MYITSECFPKRVSFFSSNLKPDGREFYCISIHDVSAGYRKEISFFENGVNKDIRIDCYDHFRYIPKRYRNLTQGSFSLPIKIEKGHYTEYRLYSFPFSSHHYLGDINGSYKLTADAVAILLRYVISASAFSTEEKQDAQKLKTLFTITFKSISESEYKGMLL